MAAVRQVALEGWRYAYSWLSPEFIEERVAISYSDEELLSALASVREADAAFWVASDARRVVGFAYARDRGEGMELVRLYVLPSHFEKGVGSDLLRLSEGFMRSKGAERYFCYVHRDNERALRFYRRRGFVHVPSGDRETPPLLRLEKQL